MYRRCVIGAMALYLFIPAAGASPIEYCRAFAIDFANQTQPDTPFWKQRLADAEKACLTQFSYEPAPKAKPRQVTKAKPKPKPAAAEPVAVPEEEQSVSLSETELFDPPAPVKSKNKREEGVIVLPDVPPPSKKKKRIEEGSVAWLDYCDRKYASFNRRTGTYRSHSGVERKCLVTANFQ